MTARSFPCPVEGCTATAYAAADDEFDHVGDYLWTCEAGHHGPRLVLNQRINTA